MILQYSQIMILNTEDNLDLQLDLLTKENHFTTGLTIDLLTISLIELKWSVWERKANYD